MEFIAAAAIVGLIAQHITCQRALAAERAQLADFVQRLYTPTTQVKLAPPADTHPFQKVKYISDEPYMDAVWDEHRGAADEEPGE